jgi:hypothetical protein
MIPGQRRSNVYVFALLATRPLIKGKAKETMPCRFETWFFVPDPYHTNTTPSI